MGRGVTETGIVDVVNDVAASTAKPLLVIVIAARDSQDVPFNLRVEGRAQIEELRRKCNVALGEDWSADDADRTCPQITPIAQIWKARKRV